MKMKIKNIVLTIIGSFVFIIGIIFINQITHRSIPKIVLKNDVFIYEYGDNIPTSIFSYIDQEKSNLHNQPVEDFNLVLNFEMENGENYPKTGEYEAKIVSSDTQESQFMIKVQDTTPPIIKQQKELQIYVGEDAQLSKCFVVQDLSDVKINIDDSQVNYMVPGTYMIKVTATDEFNNQSFLSTQIKIKKPAIHFKLEDDTLILRLNQTTTLLPEVFGNKEELKYEIADESIASIDNTGYIVPKKVGQTTIKAVLNDVEATVYLQVVEPEKQEESFFDKILEFFGFY